MNKNLSLGIGVMVVILVIVGIYRVSNQSDTAMVAPESMSEVTMMDDTMANDQIMAEDMVDKDMMDVKNGGTMEDDAVMGNTDTADSMMSAGVYEDYSADKLLRAKSGDVVLFFHASWCPSCRGLGSSIEGNLGAIPAGVSILKVDYDKETELKKKYGVTYQHTLVQVDADGNLLKKWSGSPSLDSLLTQIE